MTKRKKTTQKALRTGLIIGISALTVGSQVVSVVPTNVLAADKSKTTVATKATTTQKQTQSAKTVKAGTTVDVANYADFKAALANNEVSTINLTGDIEFPMAASYVDAILTHSVVINGNNHTINQHYSTINGLQNGANTVTFNDVNVVAENYDGDFSWFGLVRSDVEGFTINLNNVTYNGPQAIFNTNGTVNISGKTTLASKGSQENIEARNINFKQGTTASLTTPSNVGIRTTGKGSVAIEDGANVVFNNVSHSIYTSNDESKVLVAPKAVAKFTNKTTSIYMAGAKNNITIQGEANFKTDAYYGMQLNGGSNVLDVQDNAKVDLNTYQTSVYMPGSLNQVNIGANATFTAKNRELYGLHLAGENSILNIKDNANVNLQTGHTGIIMAGNGEKLNIGKAAKVDITNKAEQSIIMDGVGSVLDIKDNAEINLTSGYHSIFMPQLNSKVNVGAAVKLKADSQFGAYMPYADLNIADKAEINFNATNNAVNFPQLYVKNTTVGTDATFNVKSSPVSGHAIYLNNGSFSLNGAAAYDIQNPNPAGHAFYSEGNSNIAFNNQTVGVWKNANTTNTPTYSWDDLTGTATLNQYNSTNSMSANDNFRAVFQMNDYNRIAGKNISAPELIVNEVGDNDEAIKGTTTPGSTIKAVYGGKTVEGTVNAEGSYSIPTGKIPAGTEVVVTATAGNKDTSKTVTVVDKTAPEAPNVDPVKETDTVVKGSGEKGATVTVHLPNGTTKTGTVGEDGQFSVAIPAQEGGKQISVTLTDNANNTSTATTVTVTAEEKDYAISANNFTLGKDVYATGTVGKDVAKVKVFVNGKGVNTVTPTNNEFKAYLDAYVSNVNDEVKVISYGQDGKAKETAIVKLVQNGYTLTSDSYTIGDPYITGSYDKEATKVVLYVDGKAVKNSMLDPQTMTYKVVAPSFVTNKDQKVEMVMSKGATELKRITVNVQNPVSQYALTANDYQINDPYVTGAYDSGEYKVTDVKVVLYVDGVAVKRGTMDATSKTYKISASGFITNKSNKVEVVMTAGTKELKRVTVNVSQLYQLSANNYKLGSPYITGTYDPEATKVVLYVNGEVAKNSTLDPQTMTYKVVAPSFVTNKDQKVEMVMSNGTKELKRVQVKIIE